MGWGGLAVYTHLVKTNLSAALKLPCHLLVTVTGRSDSRGRRCGAAQPRRADVCKLGKVAEHDVPGCQLLMKAAADR